MTACSKKNNFLRSTFFKILNLGHIFILYLKILKIKAYISSSWRVFSFDVKYVKVCFQWMCSYGLKSYRRADRQTDGQTDIYKLVIYVQNSVEWYITHRCCSKKHGKHGKQYISHRHSVRHNYGGNVVETIKHHKVIKK